MAFQGVKNQGMDPLQMFLAIHQLRRQDEADKQALALARVEAAQKAREFAQKTAESDLRMQKLRMEMIGQGESNFSAMTEREQAAAPLGEGLMDQNVPLRQREAQANQFVREIERNIADRVALGQGEDAAALDVGGNIVAADARRRAKTRGEIAKEERTTSSAIEMEEARERRAEDRRLESEARARQNGYWDRKDLIAERDNQRDSFQKATENLNADWRALEEAKANPNRYDGIRLTTKWVRRTDPGASVKDGDFALMRYFSVSTMDELYAKMKGIADGDQKFSDDMRIPLLESFQAILEEDDRAVSDRWNDYADYADNQNWNDRERDTAFPKITAVRKAIRRSEDARFADVNVPVSFRTSEETVKIAEQRLRRRLGLRRSAIHPMELKNELARMWLEYKGEIY